MSPDAPTARLPRAHGLLVLVIIVAAGMGIPAYLQWKVPQLEATRDRILAEAPTDTEGRVRAWFVYGQPLVHNALTKARFSSEQPWFITHVVRSSTPSRPPQIWGLDFEDLSPDVLSIDGTVVRLTLPAPSLLLEDVLVGDKAGRVPVFEEGSEIPDPRVFARGRLERYLERPITGLSRDIEGARFEIEVGGLK